jgi:adenylate kinase family enzyme
LAILTRIVVVGCAGAGKSTFSRVLARRLGVPYVERDELGDEGTPEQRAAVERATAGDAWIFDGAPYYVEDVVYPRAQLVVALDFPKWTVMQRVIRRALLQPDARSWRDPGHPVRWAWSVWRERRVEIAELGGRTGLEVVRLRTPREARRWLAGLARSSAS